MCSAIYFALRWSENQSGTANGQLAKDKRHLRAVCLLWRADPRAHATGTTQPAYGTTTRDFSVIEALLLLDRTQNKLTPNGARFLHFIDATRERSLGCFQLPQRLAEFTPS